MRRPNAKEFIRLMYAWRGKPMPEIIRRVRNRWDCCDTLKDSVLRDLIETTLEALPNE